MSPSGVPVGSPDDKLRRPKNVLRRGLTNGMVVSTPETHPILFCETS